MKTQTHTIGQTLMLLGIKVIIAALSATFLAAAAYVIFELISNPAHEQKRRFCLYDKKRKGNR